MEVVDVFGLEVGECLSSGAIERLHTQIVDAVFTRGINHRLAIATEAQQPPAEALKVLHRDLARISLDDSQSFFWFAPMLQPRKHDLFAIGRNIEGDACARNRTSRDYFRSSALNGRSRQLTVSLLVNEVNPAAVGGAHRIGVELTVSELLEIPARRINAPDVLASTTAAGNKYNIAAVGTSRGIAADVSLFCGHCDLDAGFGIDFMKRVLLVGDQLVVSRPGEVRGRSRGG